MEQKIVNTENIPTKAYVKVVLEGLINGEFTRKEVSSWADKWVSHRAPPIDNTSVFKALTRLSGADTISADRPYLYDVIDFKVWLNELQ